MTIHSEPLQTANGNDRGTLTRGLSRGFGIRLFALLVPIPTLFPFSSLSPPRVYRIGTGLMDHALFPHLSQEELKRYASFTDERAKVNLDEGIRGIVSSPDAMISFS